MLLKDEVDILRGVPLFAGMDPSKLKLLAFASDRVRFLAGQAVFRQGDPATAAFVILSGEVEVAAEAEGGPVRRSVAGTQAVVGEIAILSDQPRDATATALSPVEALRISRDHFQKLLACCPGTMTEIIRVLGSRMSKAG